MISDLGKAIAEVSRLVSAIVFDLGSRFTGTQLFFIMIPAGCLFSAFWGKGTRRMKRRIRRATNPKADVPSEIIPFLAVSVRYPGKPDYELDEELFRMAAHKGGFGSGYDSKGEERDHSWYFEDGELDKAEALAAKLRKVPGITVSVKRIA